MNNIEKKDSSRNIQSHSEVDSMDTIKSTETVQSNQVEPTWSRGRDDAMNGSRPTNRLIICTRPCSIRKEPERKQIACRTRRDLHAVSQCAEWTCVRISVRPGTMPREKQREQAGLDKEKRER